MATVYREMKGIEAYSLLVTAFNRINSKPSSNTDWKSEDHCSEEEVLSIKATQSWVHRSEVLESGLVVFENHGDFEIDGR